MRALSAAMRRDPGYVADLVGSARPSRARPTPEDMVAASDATGIPLVELLELFWAIPAQRLADEVTRLGLAGPSGPGLEGITARERATLGDFTAFLVDRHRRRSRRAAQPE